ncbi:MAG: DUF87 domain-containing protein [Candidatus Aenigmarchaeota archaeon]|nr:DUF87 domain-containing protein [Candidatus Aenigmarchaeota archaeon]
MQEYGTVISTPEGPSTQQFSFVVHKGQVRRGQFVQVQTDEGKLIGRVMDILKTNRYYLSPESVKEYESSGRRLDEIFPATDWEYLVAQVSPLGVQGTQGFQDVLFPPSPGTAVVEPDHGLLEQFFGMVPAGLHLGTFVNHAVDVRIPPTRLLQKHLAILAMSGAGKSYLTGVLLEELLARPPQEGMAVIVIDPHGEYPGFADDPAFAGKVRVFAERDIRIGIPHLDHHHFSAYGPDLSSAQARELEKIIRGMKGSAYGLKEVIERVEATEMKQATKDVLLSALWDMASTGLFGPADHPGLEELARQGGMSVIDLSGTTSLRKKQIIAAHLADKLFYFRRKGTIPPFLLVLEEAHQFCPEKDASKQALSRRVITTIAREGRKFHACLCLISQRPVQLSTTVLSQCNTNIILRITNPYDLDHIQKSSEGISTEAARSLSSLRVGRGLIVGEAVNAPLFLQVRPRRGRNGDKGTDLLLAAREYWEKAQQRKQDAKSFM